MYGGGDYYQTLSPLFERYNLTYFWMYALGLYVIFAPDTFCEKQKIAIHWLLCAIVKSTTIAASQCDDDGQEAMTKML